MGRRERGGREREEGEREGGTDTRTQTDGQTDTGTAVHLLTLISTLSPDTADTVHRPVVVFKDLDGNPTTKYAIQWNHWPKAIGKQRCSFAVVV